MFISTHTTNINFCPSDTCIQTHISYVLSASSCGIILSKAMLERECSVSNLLKGYSVFSLIKDDLLNMNPSSGKMYAMARGILKWVLFLFVIIDRPSWTSKSMTTH